MNAKDLMTRAALATLNGDPAAVTIAEEALTKLEQSRVRCHYCGQAFTPEATSMGVFCSRDCRLNDRQRQRD